MYFTPLAFLNKLSSLGECNLNRPYSNKKVKFTIFFPCSYFMSMYFTPLAFLNKLSSIGECNLNRPYSNKKVKLREKKILAAIL